MSMTRFQRAFLATARHGVVALTIASITFSGNLLALPVFAQSGAAPKPLAVTEKSVAAAPERFYLPALSAPGWASDSAGLYWQNGSTIEPFSQSVNDVPMVPYRLHEAEDSLVVELPSANGRQLIEFDRSAPSYRIYEYAPSEDAFVLTARQTLEFQAFDVQSTPTETPEPTEEPTPTETATPSEEPTPTPSEEPTPTPTPSEEPTPTPSEEPPPTPTESPSAFRWLRDLVGLSAHAEDSENIRERVTISSVETAYELEEGSVTITQSFQATTGDGTWPGYVRATFGFDGRSTVNKWTYVIEDDGIPAPEFRLRASTEFAGNAEPILGDARGAYKVTIVPEEVEPTAEPAPSEVPPTPEPEQEPTPEPTESIEPTLEPEAPTPAEEAPEEPPAQEESPVEPEEESAPPADEPISLLERAWRWLVPVASADEGSGALQWIQELFSSEEPLEFTVVFDVRDHDGEVTTELEENILTTTFSGSDNAPDGTAFYVDPSLGALWDMQGITVQSGDGSNPADFKLHFDLASGGAIDELYQNGDFVVNRVSSPASVSGGLTLVNVGTAVQAAQSATLTVEEASSVRVVIKNELPGLTERYSIYPSGRVVKAVVVDTPEDTTADFYLNGAMDGYDAEAALPGDAMQLLTGAGPDVLLAWHDPTSLASASLTSGPAGGSRTTVASVPLLAGQHTFYQLIELSQAVTLTDPASYLRYAEDYRTPDEPAMTRGIFLGFAPSRAAYQFEAVNNVVVFRLNGSLVPRINPMFEVSNWSDPDLTAFKAQLNGYNMVEGVDYAIGFKNGDASTGVLLFQYLHTIQQGDQFNVEGEDLPPLFDLDPSDAAAIKRVQSGEFVMPTASTVGTITLPFPVLTSRSWVIAGGLFEGSTNGTPSDPEKSRMTFWLESPTTIRVQRTAVGTGLASASWRLVEFEDNSGALVQRGSISFGTTDLSLGASLSTNVNTTKSWAEVSVRGGSTDQANDERWTVRASLSADTLQLSRNESTIALQTTWQVIQVDGVSVQRGLTSLAGATVTNVTIASVNTNKSFVVSTARSSAGAAGIDSQYHYLTRLTSSTNLRINKYNATNGVDVSWFVVTFTGTSGNRVQGGVLNYTASLTDLSRSASVSPSVVATRSFVLGSEAGAVGGDTADLDALTFGVRNLTADGDTVHVRRNYAGTARAASASWSVIEWTRPAIQQNRYRWRNDDGTEVTATALAAENASVSLTIGVRKRLRLGLFDSDTGSATNQYRLEFTRKQAGATCTTLSAGWTWRQVPVTPSVASDAFDLSDSPNFVDAAATTNAAGVLTDDDTVFVAGETKDTGSQTSSIGLASTSFTEIEFAIQPNSNAVAGNKYCFRVTDAGEDRASHSFIFYPRYAEAEVQAAATFTQDTFRWYANLNAITPTDPWTPGGGADLPEDEALVFAHWNAPGRGTQIRLRANVLVGTGAMATNSAAFAIQFSELPVGIVSCAAAASWTDVGASTSGSVWRFGSNAGVTDGATLPSTLLSTSDVRGSYEESNPTASNSFGAAVGQSVEYDFSLQNNTAPNGSQMCFRLRSAAGAVLTGYNRYPSIMTPPSPESPDKLMRHGKFFSVQGYEQPYYWADIF